MSKIKKNTKERNFTTKNSSHIDIFLKELIEISKIR